MAKASSKKTSSRKPPEFVNTDEVTAALGRVGEISREIQTVNNAINEQVKTITEPAITRVAELKETLLLQCLGIFNFAEANRKELTNDNKRKTIPLPTGEFGWRMNPPSLKVSNLKKIIAALKAAELQRFVRTKETLDKQALIQEPDVVSGIRGMKIVQEEDFFVKASEIMLEIDPVGEKFKKPKKEKKKKS